jgi:NADH-quinone oxidoreductase subunit F
MSPKKRVKKLRHLSELESLINQEKEKRQKDNRPLISISSGTCGRARGSDKLAEAFKKALRQQNLQDKVILKVTGCHGFCEAEPNVVIYPESFFYQKLEPRDAIEIINRTILKGEIIDDFLYLDPVTGEKATKEADIPFYKKQKRLVLGDNPLVDPTDIFDYLSLGGYSSLLKVLSSFKSEEVIETIKKSGLRGRGGAGFPTGKKWEFARAQKSDVKYIICNADEGDPGAYMDRSLLEGNPHRVIEGMIIGAYAIGAEEGYIYVRDEYPLAVQHVSIAIDQARQLGLLGKNILGTGFNFDLHIAKGAGAFVCGEETALIASIEGRVGEPRQRPPFPAVKGLWGKPTVINNVETWGNVPIIIEKGADWYASIGTNGSKGTKIFSLVGKINNTGLVEVPMGITLREIIFDIGGGIPGGRKFKAVQTGGPSGGCLPEKLLDLPIDYESLTQAGSIMGSGGMIVMDDRTCMVDVARYFLNFLRDESCGKCISCREGTQRLWEIVTEISEGKGTMEHLALLEELAIAVKEASLCGLGQTAPNPVLSTLRYFRDEYEAHIKDKRCPAGVCKPLIRYSILAEKCTGCLACLRVCPQGAISGELKKVHVLDESKCIKCGACFEACQFGAILIE